MPFDEMSSVKVKVNLKKTTAVRTRVMAVEVEIKVDRTSANI
jgi:hypothetical protein